MEAELPLLSICIATRNRARDIAMCLDALLPECLPYPVEVVVVDGASTDDTSALVVQRTAKWSALKYFPQSVNSGVDGDYDKAVLLARGQYCWLLSDDDLPTPGALVWLLQACEEGHALIVTDAEVWAEDFSVRLQPGRMSFHNPRVYTQMDQSELLRDCGNVLSFIGALTIRRDLWLARDRKRYYGTEFVHVGVVFQGTLPGTALAISRASLRIRYGVGNWVRRAFHVWMCKWPELIWSFDHLCASARTAVVQRYPWRSPVLLLVYRSRAWYGWSQFSRYISQASVPFYAKIIPCLIALLPGILVWTAVYCALRLRPGRHPGLARDIHDSPYALWKRIT